MKTQVVLPFLVTTLVISGYPIIEIARADQPIQIAQSIWKPFSPPEGGFTILMPGTPTSEQEILDSPTGPITLNGFRAVRPGEAIYFVSYGDLPDSALNSPGGINDLLTSFTQQFTTTMDGVTVTQQSISLNNYPGAEVKLQTNEGITFRSRIYLVNNRMYTLGVFTVREQDLQKSIQGFLDSFRLTNASPGVSLTPQLAPQEDLNAQLNQSVCNQNWSQAIKIIDRMLANNSNSAELRQQLTNYRSRLQTFANSNTRIPAGELSNCSSGKPGDN